MFQDLDLYCTEFFVLSNGALSELGFSNVGGWYGGGGKGIGLHNVGCVSGLRMKESYLNKIVVQGKLAFFCSHLNNQKQLQPFQEDSFSFSLIIKISISFVLKKKLIN